MCVGDFGGQSFRGRGVFMSRKSLGVSCSVVVKDAS